MTRTRPQPPAAYDFSVLRQAREASIVEYMTSRTKVLTDMWTATPAPALPPFPDDAQSYTRWVVQLLKEQPRVDSVTFACLETLNILLKVVGLRMSLSFLEEEHCRFMCATSQNYLYCSDDRISRATLGILMSLSATGRATSPLVSPS